MNVCVREDGGDGMWVHSGHMRVGDRFQSGSGVLMEVVGEDNGQWLVREARLDVHFGETVAENARRLIVWG